MELFRVDGAFQFRSLFRREYQAKEHQVALDPDGFRLEIWDFSRDTLRGCCEAFPYRYAIQGDRVIRVQPIGFNPHQFLEAWKRAEWDEVAGFTDPATRAKLQAYHRQLPVMGEYGQLPERCDDLAKLWQISFNGTAWFRIERTGTWHFRLRDVTPEPVPSCKQDDAFPWLRTMFEKPLE